MTPMDQYALWRRTLAVQSDGFDPQREILRQAFLGFRERTAQLVGEIAGLLPGLTVHDITHLDALWRVADEVAGPDYPVNPAEAFVLGGAFLLHDAAHVLAAYDDGLAGIKRTIEWKDLIAQRFGNSEPTPGSPEERSALFQVLRHLHAKQARQLPKVSWKVPSTGEQIHLIEHFALREFYGDLIAQIAESHHWPAHHVAETFADRHTSAPAFLAPAVWSVDALKVSLLLRIADAAHIDAQRAPWFLFALRQPEGISLRHWKFQSKMGQPARTDRRELRLSSGSSFDRNERQAWWLAYDVACMIDRELRDAQILMRDSNRICFAAMSVEHVSSPEIYATNVRTTGWEPINVAPKIVDVPKVIANLGGAKLYGNRPELALRELIQNAADAVRALRALDEIAEKDGEIEVALEHDGDHVWLHVTDTGIGMSRYVLTEVLLDFGNSLWSNESLRIELPGLASRGFRAIGRFGIGFFSVFMLGRKVAVTTRRFSRSNGDNGDQWLLEFDDGLAERPTLRRPTPHELLKRPGTRVSIALNNETLERIQKAQVDSLYEKTWYGEEAISADEALSKCKGVIKAKDFQEVVASLCPTIDVKVLVKIKEKAAVTTVAPHDWQKMKSDRLLNRLYSRFAYRLPRLDATLIDLREPSGLLVGRLGHAGGVCHAMITHGGMWNGNIPRLVGVALGTNNSDLARMESKPLASREAWQQWAETLLDSTQNHNLDTLIDLHLLCPERDLAVYRIGESQLTEGDLSKWLRRHSEVSVINGLPDCEDYDDVAQDRFDREFTLGSDVLALPVSDKEFAISIGLQRINYLTRLEAVLRNEWEEFEKWDDSEVEIGDVGGTIITRSWVDRYVRVERVDSQT